VDFCRHVGFGILISVLKVQYTTTTVVQRSQRNRGSLYNATNATATSAVVTVVQPDKYSAGAVISVVDR